MDVENQLQSFNQTVDVWLQQLASYSIEDILAKPSAESWSLGQVYVHCINDTKYYLQQVRLCLLTNENMNEEASEDGKTMLLNNSFPIVEIKGDPSHTNIPQPGSKEKLTSDLQNLKAEADDLKPLFFISGRTGKTKHPGLGYLNAAKWLQFGEMHFRHHLRQKERIDKFLQQGHS
jgi:hypothetical protein